MWEILQFSFSEDSQDPTAGLLDSSLSPPITQEDLSDSSTLEIIVATSPEITINTADGGQEAPTLSYKGPAPPPPSTRGSPWQGPRDDRGGEQTDSLTFNFTPWLYADSTQFVNMGDMGDMGYNDLQPAMGETRGIAWWEGENFSNMMNHF